MSNTTKACDVGIFLTCQGQAGLYITTARAQLCHHVGPSSRPTSGCVFCLRPPDGADRDAVTIFGDQSLEMRLKIHFTRSKLQLLLGKMCQCRTLRKHVTWKYVSPVKDRLASISPQCAPNSVTTLGRHLGRRPVVSSFFVRPTGQTATP